MPDTGMFDLTPELLRKIAGAPINKTLAESVCQWLPDMMVDYGINTKLRAAHFLAQLSHESDHFRTVTEYASGNEYEGRRDLGNVYRGDGRRYKGRGLIQLTGRYNYRKYGKKMGLDLENDPQLLEQPKYACLSAVLFWVNNGLNELADNDDIYRITRRINGGTNGLREREAALHRAKSALPESMFQP